MVVIGIDPHMVSQTACAIDGRTCGIARPGEICQPPQPSLLVGPVETTR
jgi:hypothetical protein